VLRRNRSPGRRPAWIRFAWPAAALFVLAVAVVEFGHRSAGFGSAADAPAWIWRNHDLRHVQAAGFYAVKEFDLVETPAKVEARILGDAE
jgi:hypothetical protein